MSRTTEEKLARLSRLYSVISKINGTIIRARDPQELYEEACRIAVEEGLFKMAWIGLVDADSQTVKPVAYKGFEKGYLDKINISTRADVPEGKGPTGTAVREGRYVAVDDFWNDPRMAPWRAAAMKRGYRSSAAFPMHAGGRVIGALNLYSSEPSFFAEEEETRTLQQLADDVSFAVDVIEKDEQRKRLEQEALLMQSIALEIARAKDFENALAIVIRKMCEETGWVYGEAWVPSRDGGHLEQSYVWHGNARLAEFHRASASFTFPKEVGLPGRAWTSGEPEWIKDVTLDDSFLRRDLARDYGLKAAVGIPIFA